MKYRQSTEWFDVKENLPNDGDSIVFETVKGLTVYGYYLESYKVVLGNRVPDKWFIQKDTEIEYELTEIIKWRYREIINAT